MVFIVNIPFWVLLIIAAILWLTWLYVSLGVNKRMSGYLAMRRHNRRIRSRLEREKEVVR